MSKDTFVTAVRIRPLLPRELSAGCNECLEVQDNTIQLTDPAMLKFLRNPHADPTQYRRHFNYDFAFDSRDNGTTGITQGHQGADQAIVFRDVGAFLISAAIQGYNCSLFAYGQTGSGKSYTVMGSGNNHCGGDCSSEEEAEYGLVPRVGQALFEELDNISSETTRCWLEASFLEIYNERVRDLFATTASTGGDSKVISSLRVREHPSEGPYVEGLSHIRLDSFADMKRLLLAGTESRTVATTRMNEASSRSHAVFTIKLIQVSL